MKPSGPELLFIARFKITVSISILVIGLFVFPVSSWFSLGDCSFLRICPFLLGGLFCFYIVPFSSLLRAFVLCGLSCNFLFHFWFYWFEPSPFFSWWVCLKVYPYCLSWNPLLVSLIFCCCFLHLYFIYICSDLYVYFFLLSFGFVCSFSSCFWCKFRLFI